MIPFTKKIQQQCQSKAKPAPFQKGRCYDGWKPNPDGRPASQQGSCVKE